MLYFFLFLYDCMNFNTMVVNLKFISSQNFILPNTLVVSHVPNEYHFKQLSITLYFRNN